VISNERAGIHTGCDGQNTLAIGGNAAAYPQVAFTKQGVYSINAPKPNETHAMAQVLVTLPDEVAQQAQQAGLLRPEVLAHLLRETLRKDRVERLFATMNKLAQLTPPLTEDEIEAEIDAARAARRARS